MNLIIHSLLISAVLLSYSRVSNAQPFSVDKIAVGAIFDQNTEEIQNVFKFAMMQHNQNISSRGTRLELQAYVDVINTADAFKLSRLICNQFARGVFAMLGAVTPDSFDTLHSYTNTFQMPFVTPWFPEKVIPPSSGLIDHAVSLRPDYHRAIVDTIVYYRWNEIIYMYDSHDGLLRLQQLYQSMQPGHTAFKIGFVKRIYNSSDAIDFLLSLEHHDRWGNKRIVLDCHARNAKQILVGHVRNLQLGRRTYHYMLSGLVMDDRWENEVVEYGAVNITGFRIVDQSRRIVRDFMDGLRKMDPQARETISAQAALMYDGVQVLIDALGRLWRKKPEAFRSGLRRAAGQQNVTRGVDCNPGKSWVVPFEHGDKISRLIKKTDIEGLSGKISFNEEGHRHNFTLHVVEMTIQSAMVKVATWSDVLGLIPVAAKHVELHSPGSYDRNKTYIITTTLQEPYMMLRNERGQYRNNDIFFGFCKDLADYIGKELAIKYEIRVVRDGKYGSESPQTKGGWNGLVGELLRKEADIAIAPLAVTLERETVIDFTEPFISMSLPPTRMTSKYSSETFSFLRPLSKEIWVCVLFSFFAVSIVLFLVSRFSPREWRSLGFTDSHSDHSLATQNEIILHNEFSIWNSFWFSLGSFMQQGSDVIPRSLSGRIVSTVWWFFALILVCSYTANLAAYLTVDSLAEPLTSYGLIRENTQPHDKYQMSHFKNDQGNKMPDDEIKKYSTEPGGFHSCQPSKGAFRSCNYKHVDFAVAIPKGSYLKESIDLAMMTFKKTGQLAKLRRKWLLRLDTFDCANHPFKETPNAELTLGQVAGVFYVLVGGLALALAVALLEFCQHGRAEAARANLSLGAALRAKARLASRNERKPRATTPQAARAARPPDHDRLDRLGWNGTPFAGYYTTANQIGQDEVIHASFTHV